MKSRSACSWIPKNSQVFQIWVVLMWINITLWKNMMLKPTILKSHSFRTWLLKWLKTIRPMRNSSIRWIRNWSIRTDWRSWRMSRPAPDTRCQLIWMLAPGLSLRACWGCVIPTWRIALVLSNKWLWRKLGPPLCSAWRRIMAFVKSWTKSLTSQWQ